MSNRARNKLLDKWVLDRTLTARQGEVTEYMICGYTNAEIAEELAVSKNTVATHVKNVLERVGVANRRKLAALCFIDEELTEHLELTNGWPSALSFTLHSSSQLPDVRGVRASTSERMYSYLAEQVFTTLSKRERELISFAALMPRVDIKVLQHAGYDNAAVSLEDLCNRAAFIIADKTQQGIYHYHDLFRNFVRYQIGLEGETAIKASHAKIATAYEAAGEFANALHQYSDAQDTAAILRILDEHGFSLMDEANGDIVARAIDILDPTMRATAMPTALRGLLEAEAGRYDEAELYLQRAADQARDPEQRAQVLLPAARIAAIRGNNDLTVLKSIENDETVSSDSRAFARALALNLQIRSGQYERAMEKLHSITNDAHRSESPRMRIRLLHLAGNVAIDLGDAALARDLHMSVAESATEHGLHSMASKAFSGLAITAGLHQHDATHHLRFAQQAWMAAAKGGEMLDFQTSALILLEAEVRRGNVQQIIQLEKQLGQLSTDSHLVCVSYSLAVRNGWEGNFEEAFRVMSTIWERENFVPERGIAGGYCAVYAAACGRSNQAKALVSTITNLVEKSLSPDKVPASIALYGDIAMLFCALAEAIAGRQTSAKRILKRGLAADHEYAARLKHLVAHTVRAIKRRTIESKEIVDDIKTLQHLGFGGHAMLVQAVINRCVPQKIKAC